MKNVVKGIDRISFCDGMEQGSAVSFAVGPFEIERGFTSVDDTIRQFITQFFANRKSIVLDFRKNFFTAASEREQSASNKKRV
jgi:hypothetical protein